MADKTQKIMTAMCVGTALYATYWLLSNIESQWGRKPLPVSLGNTQPRPAGDSYASLKEQIRAVQPSVKETRSEDPYRSIPGKRHEYK